MFKATLNSKTNFIIQFSRHQQNHKSLALHWKVSCKKKRRTKKRNEDHSLQLKPQNRHTTISANFPAKAFISVYGKDSTCLPQIRCKKCFFKKPDQVGTPLKSSVLATSANAEDRSDSGPMASVLIVEHLAL